MASSAVDDDNGDLVSTLAANSLTGFADNTINVGTPAANAAVYGGGLDSTLLGQIATNAQTQNNVEANKVDTSLAPYTSQVISDLNSNNFAGAWATAEGTAPAFGTNSKSATTDPLLQALESSEGLEALDPSKQWTAAETGNYYAALGDSAGYTNGSLLGQNQYGLWGNQADVTNGTDAKTNIAQGGDTPNVEQFAGQVPPKTFLDKYGPAIAALVATVATAGAGAGTLGAAFSGTVAGDLATAGAGGTPSILGNVLGLAGAAIPGAGQALGSLTGIGTTAGSAAVGAGVGALTGKLTGGSPLVGALSGGVSGAVQGSGLTNQAGQAINSATGLPVSVGAGLTGGAVGAATGAGLGALTGTGVAGGALSGGVTGALRSGIGSATGSSGLGTAAGALGGMAISPLLSNGGGSAVAAPATATGTMDSTGTTGTGYDFSSVGSTLGSLLGPALQAGAGVYGAQNAAEDESNWINNAINEQNTTLGNVTGIYGAQTSAGNNAFNALQGLQGGTTTPASYANFENSPGYQYAISQGTQAIQRQAAATGQGYTPNTEAAVGQYVTGTASQNYNNYVSQLLSTAQLGSAGNQGLASANTTIGGNISQLMQSEGQAQAGGVAGSAGAVSSVLGGVGSGISNLLGGGSGLTSTSSGNGTLLDNGSPAGSVDTSDLGTNLVDTTNFGTLNNSGFNSVTDTGNSDLYSGATGGVGSIDWLDLGNP